MIKPIILVLLFCSAAFGQAVNVASRPAAPERNAAPRSNATFWRLAVADIALNTLDVGTTLYDSNVHHTYEQNPLFGRHPSNARFVVQYAIMETAYIYAAHRINRHHPTIARVMLLGDMGVEGLCLRNNFKAMGR